MYDLLSVIAKLSSHFTHLGRSFRTKTLIADVLVIKAKEILVSSNGSLGCLTECFVLDLPQKTVEQGALLFGVFNF